MGVGQSLIHLPETVVPAKAGVSTGSCCEPSPEDVSLRWDDVRFERDGSKTKHPRDVSVGRR